MPVAISNLTYNFDLMEFKALTVSQYRNHKSSRSGNCNRDIDVVSLNHIGSIDDCIDYWVVVDSSNCSSNEKGHETELNAVLGYELILELLRS